MAIDAKLLVLDEPTLGLDILMRKQFYETLLNEYFDEQRTILVTTHQVEEIEHILTDLIFIDRGPHRAGCSDGRGAGELRAGRGPAGAACRCAGATSRLPSTRASAAPTCCSRAWIALILSVSATLACRPSRTCSSR